MAEPSLAAMASQLESFAANEIQRCYRGHVVRQQRRARLQLEQFAAVVIQACFKGYTTRLFYRDELEARRQKQQEHQDAMLAKQTWLGYMARKQMEKLRGEQQDEMVAIKQADAATKIQAHQRGRSARVHTAVALSVPAAELRRKCQHSQTLALTYVSKIGWGEGQAPTYETQRFLAAKWRARRYVIKMDQHQVAEMLAEVTGLPQYKQVFIAAYIHGKRFLTLSAEAFTQLGVRQHDHRKIHYSAVCEIQKYCNDMEYVPADFMYPDKYEDSMRKKDAETRYRVEFGATSYHPAVVNV
mmetsp:Transcript_22764/g.38052  ORF Transcript_22764/g.38052 Transcript_22764/m.38052 type:complete len:299 (+) Transcript_22764:229-1125(+)|eukprot:CAMPEP_0198201794 /NCGR_PEP_ID=MMETSP1445-20131203/4804_1 /TAXON_ID=36898 /ORGANISM="Pyramimonas sp., Strain CCMP2087" /LENGTH=298 /DNA_ID=CAMNT_0043872399 /DNA_START=214 /DNA_END=1110 /DNA_ORIENTATION=-